MPAGKPARSTQDDRGRSGFRWGWRPLSLLIALALAVSSCGGGRNCLVIPAQVDLVSQRREAEIKTLETKANRLDRMKRSLEASKKRCEDLKAEKLLLEELELD